MKVYVFNYCKNLIFITPTEKKNETKILHIFLSPFYMRKGIQ